MAHKKAGGSTALGRDSEAQRLGIKITHGGLARAGSIIVRQRGTKFRAGMNVGRGTDDTLFALADGEVQFKTKKIYRYTNKLRPATFVSVAVNPVRTEASRLVDGSMTLP